MASHKGDSIVRHPIPVLLDGSARSLKIAPWPELNASLHCNLAIELYKSYYEIGRGN